MQHEPIDTANATRLAPRSGWTPKGRYEAGLIDLARGLKGDPLLTLALRGTQMFLAIFAIFVVLAAPFAAL